MTQLDDLQAYVNLELPRRSALLNFTITGYDGDPNLSSGVPVIITGAPTGTWYHRQSTNQFYRKISSGSWILGGVDSLSVEGKTSEALTFTVDQGSGTDPADGIFDNQAKITDHGSFQSIEGVLDRLPRDLFHPVTLSFVDGTYTFAGFELESLPRFNWGTNAAFTSGQIIFKSANGLVRAVSTTTMAVASATSVQVVLGSDPGFSANQYRGYWLRVVSGTGAGQYKAIRNHSGTTFNLAGRYSPVLDATSVVEIVSPAAVINMTGFGVMLRTVEQQWLQAFDDRIVFDAIDIQHSTGATVYAYASTSWVNGTRLLGCSVEVGANMSIDNVVFDGQAQAGPFGILDVVHSTVRSKEANSSILIRDATGPGVGMIVTQGGLDGRQSTGYLFKIAIDDCVGSGVLLRGQGAFVHTETLLIGSGNGRYGIEIDRGARVDVSIADMLTDPLSGTLGDLWLDGTVLTWSDVDGDADKFIWGPLDSRVVGV